jgi:GMP synthase-like glutamine amidotransferase
VVGLQFHLEVTRSGAAVLVENCGGELKTDDFVAPPQETLSAQAPFEKSHDLMIKLLERLNTI